MRRDHHAHRVAVRRRLRDDLGADHRAGAGLEVEHNGLAPDLVQLLRHQPGNDVGGAAGGNGTIMRTDFVG